MARGPVNREHASGETTEVTVSRVVRGDRHIRVSTLDGDGDGRPFLLVSGIGVASNYYVRLALDLNRVGDVHAVDLPGFGGVRYRGPALSIPEFAELVGAVIDDLGLENPVLIGHSMGAQVVTELAATRPELTSLVLIGPVVDDEHRHVLDQARRLIASALHEPFAITVYVLSSYVLCGPRWFLRVLPKMMSYPIEERIEKVQAHTLIVRGDHDANCPPAWAERLAGLAPSARAWEIPDAAHSVMYKHAREVATLCIEHIARPAQPSDGPVRLQRPTERTHEDQRPRFTLRHLGKQVQGIVTTVRGMVKDDDRLIAHGSRAEHEALDET